MYLKKARNIATLFAISIITLLVSVFLFISPIAEYLLEHKSREYTGRQIQLDNLRINLLNGVIKAENLKIFEANTDSVFISIGKLYINTNLLSFISGNNTIDEILVGMPVVHIEQAGERFNFDDLISRFSDTTAAAEPIPSEPVKYLLQNLSISQGSIHYRCNDPQVNAGVIALNLNCQKIAWDDPLIALNADFAIQSGGKTIAGLSYNAESGDYSLSLDLKEMDIQLLFPYLRDYLFVKSLDGIFSTRLNIRGNPARPADIAASGFMEIHNFSLVDTTSEELASIGALSIQIDTVNPEKDLYYFGNIKIDRPFVRFAMYDDGYNFDRIMVMSASASASDSVTAEAPVEQYTNIFRMMAGYIAYFTEQYKISNYKAEGFDLTNGHILYTDYTLENKFQYNLDSLQLHSFNLNSGNERINMSLDAIMNTSGIMKGSLSVNPDGFSEMEIRYSVDGLLLSDINPYSVYHVATPFIDGRVYFSNTTEIRNKQLKSLNNLRVEQVSVGEKIKNNTAMNLPVKLAVSILKDLDGNINLTIPVEGNLDDPTYKWGKVVWQVLKNIIVKAAVSPYRLIAGMFGGNEEDYNQIRFEYLQARPGADQIEIFGRLTEVLKQKPELQLSFVQFTNSTQETEILALMKAKQRYLGLPQADSLLSFQMKQINAVTNRDSLFNAWLDRQQGMVQGLTSVQEKSVKLFGKEHLIREVQTYESARNAFLAGYFKSAGFGPERFSIQQAVQQDEQAAQAGPRFSIHYKAAGEDPPE